jgi:hypothetical protein
MPKNKKTTIKIAGVAYVLFFAGAGAGIVDSDSDKTCGGVERWEQKVLTDSSVDQINTDEKVTTIETMNEVRTDTIHIGENTERGSLEMQVYKIKDCFITHAIKEKDNDFHLVIEDGHGHTMVAEIPDPACPEAKKSEFNSEFKAARKTFLKYQNVYNHYRFDITGVRFIDKKHSKPPIGNWKNNVELHPVINLQPTSQF